MKVSVYLKKNSSSTSNICFRVRERNVDIKVVSPLVVHDKYWDADILSYKRTTAVPAVEQKRLPEQIAAIIEKVEKTFSDKGGQQMAETGYRRCAISCPCLRTQPSKPALPCS